MSTVPNNHFNLSLIQYFTQSIRFQILYRGIDEFWDMINPDDFTLIAGIRIAGGDDVMENRSEITGTTAYIKDLCAWMKKG